MFSLIHNNDNTEINITKEEIKELSPILNKVKANQPNQMF